MNSQILHGQARLNGFAQTFILPYLDPLRANVSKLLPLQRRYNDLSAKVKKIYGRGVECMFMYTQEEIGEYSLPCFFRPEEGNVPRLVLVLPTFLGMRRKLIEEFGEKGSRMFTTSVFLLFMHEMEHAGNNPSPSPTTYEEYLSCERVAWAWTCEFTIGPLVDQFKFPLTPADASCYSEWIRAERKVNHPNWKAAVERVYGPLYTEAGLLPSVQSNLPLASRIQPVIGGSIFSSGPGIIR